MLTGARRSAGDELSVRTVGFQTGPAHTVDDLLLTFSNGTVETTLAVACRETPSFVPSDDSTVKLVGTLLQEIEKHDAATHGVAVAVAVPSNQWTNLSKVCSIA